MHSGAESGELQRVAEYWWRKYPQMDHHVTRNYPWGRFSGMYVPLNGFICNGFLFLRTPVQASIT